MDKLHPAEGPPGLKGERWCYLETERYCEVAIAEVCDSSYPQRAVVGS